ncbi:MAG: cbb3-type cytochrome oxidase assembly protein CcoS [Rhodocyclaceae bacterium]
MESLYLLIPISVLLVFLIGAIFWWALKSGQLDDLEGPAYRVLMDDDTPQQAPARRNEATSSTVDPDQSK